MTINEQFADRVVQIKGVRQLSVNSGYVLRRYLTVLSDGQSWSDAVHGLLRVAVLRAYRVGLTIPGD
ncbi:hypothetical protein AB0M54_40240 [Actinoplanes sp. NPDC051470]|uniref:hypothetical protein n=1 Tax=unclassified Actinoplanes TaxID=2626549 RepID=UPI00342A4044